MQLALTRAPSVKGATLGQLYDVSDPRTPAWLCWTLEDVVRPADAVKVAAATAIPNGIYRVIITHSTRFNKRLPLLLNVPNFTGIRIHAGNTTEDTAGCILVGQLKGPDQTLRNSRAALESVIEHLSGALLAGEPVSLAITMPPLDAAV